MEPRAAVDSAMVQILRPIPRKASLRPASSPGASRSPDPAAPAARSSVMQDRCRSSAAAPASRHRAAPHPRRAPRARPPPAPARRRSASITARSAACASARRRPRRAWRSAPPARPTAQRLFDQLRASCRSASRCLPAPPAHCRHSALVAVHPGRPILGSSSAIPPARDRTAPLPVTGEEIERPDDQRPGKAEQRRGKGGAHAGELPSSPPIRLSNTALRSALPNARLRIVRPPPAPPWQARRTCREAQEKSAD